ncbi:MAG: site-2 protease family protein [Candidatus Saccharibacteria bacterium]
MNIDIVYLLIVLGVILFSMTLHEAMHAYASYWLGDDTARLLGRLSLNPIKHIDPVLTILMPILLALSGLPIFGGAKPVPFNPQNLRFGEWGMAIVALAGPLTNLLIAFLSFGLWVLVGSSHQSQLVMQIFATMVSVNLGFFVFNMLPLPPLDGSRVLYVLAPEFVRRVMEKIERFGIMVVFLILLVSGSAVSMYMSGAIGFFLNIFSHIFGGGVI